MESKEEQASKRRRGCFFYGCITGLVLTLVVVLGGLVGLRYAKKMFNEFTETKPMEFPAVTMSRDEIDKLEKRLDTFRQSVRAEKPTEPLILSSDEINALIATDPDFSAVKGKLYATLSGDKVEGLLSVPMESVGLPIFKGRYLNGKGTFTVSVRNGILRLNVLDFVVKGKPVPTQYMEQIRKQNLAEGVNSQPRPAAAMDKLKEIKVEDSKLVVVPK